MSSITENDENFQSKNFFLVVKNIIKKERRYC